MGEKYQHGDTLIARDEATGKLQIVRYSSTLDDFIPIDLQIPGPAKPKLPVGLDPEAEISKPLNLEPKFLKAQIQESVKNPYAKAAINLIPTTVGAIAKGAYELPAGILGLANQLMNPVELSKTGQAVGNLLQELPKSELASDPYSAFNKFGESAGQQVRNYFANNAVENPGQILFDAATLFPIGLPARAKFTNTQKLLNRIRQAEPGNIVRNIYARKYTPVGMEFHVPELDVPASTNLDAIKEWETITGRAPSIGTATGYGPALAIESSDPRIWNPYVNKLERGLDPRLNQLYNEAYPGAEIPFGSTQENVADIFTRNIKKAYEDKINELNSVELPLKSRLEGINKQILEFPNFKEQLKTKIEARANELRQEALRDVTSIEFPISRRDSQGKFLSKDKLAKRQMTVREEELVKRIAAIEEQRKAELANIPKSHGLDSARKATEEELKEVQLARSNYERDIKYTPTSQFLSGDEYERLIKTGESPAGVIGREHNPNVDVVKTLERVIDSPEDTFKALHKLPGMTPELIGQGILNTIRNKSFKAGKYDAEIFSDRLIQYARGLAEVLPGREGAKIRTGLQTFAHTLRRSAELPGSNIIEMRQTRGTESAIRNIAATINTDAVTRRNIGIIQAATIGISSHVFNKLLLNPSSVFIMNKLAGTKMGTKAHSTVLREFLNYTREANLPVFILDRNNKVLNVSTETSP